MPAGNRKYHPVILLLASLAILATAALTGRWLLVLSVTFLPYLAWQIYNGWRLHYWLGNNDGKLPASFGIWSDIFARINALQEQNTAQQEQLREVITEFRNVTDAFPDATLVIDESDSITWFNDAACQLLGLRNPEDLGQPVTNLIRNPDFANWVSVQDRVESKLEMPCPHKDHIRLIVSAVSYREGQRLLILRDITDIHNLERVRRDFVANVSHELRTPLTVLLGYLEALSDQCPDEIRGAVDGMQSHARQIQALLKDLLKLSRLESDGHAGEEQVIDVPAMLMQLKEQAEELSRGKHRLHFEIQPGLFLRGIAEDLESAFRNLIANAVNYTPDRGAITVRWEQADDGPEFSVSDTGIGIPYRDIPRLTERFYRVGAGRSRNTGGTGLGLSIVKHVLNAHQAQLLIESELGSGSRFCCVFPAERSASRELKPVEP